MDEIYYEYKIQDVGFQETSCYLNARFRRGALTPIVIAFVIVITSFVFLTYFKILEIGSGDPALLSIFLVFLGFIIAFVTVISLQTKRYFSEIEHSPWYQGTTKITLSKKGIHAIQASGEQSVRWNFVTEVLVDQSDKVLFLMSPAEFIPCPDASLPSGLTRAALLGQVFEWRNAAT